MSDAPNEGREEKQLEQDAKEYLLKQGTHDRPDITEHDFKEGWQCGYSRLRDQLSKEREKIDGMSKHFQELHDKFIGYATEYEQEAKRDTNEWNVTFFKGKCEGYRYAAKRLNDAMNWLGIAKASELDKN